MATYFGANSVYVVFVAQTVHDIINFNFGTEWEVRAYIAIVMIPFLLIAEVSFKIIVLRSQIQNKTKFIIMTHREMMGLDTVSPCTATQKIYCTRLSLSVFIVFLNSLVSRKNLRLSTQVRAV